MTPRKNSTVPREAPKENTSGLAEPRRPRHAKAQVLEPRRLLPRRVGGVGRVGSLQSLRGTGVPAAQGAGRGRPRPQGGPTRSPTWSDRRACPAR